ncbi:RICIN domain-containing protein [Streptomyces bathyalis]|uniref:RICIN domain-containing protein n=1 Tax=Streptomyces bathyalis TaxID=2710756 RepID=A0A7T1WU57_9ACTN|nr:RICIN domain-containing protein [Streptomyces bathyalis]QPP05155.1 RICIN domain-containing protein [Streptomyces bathyalis]QPP07540.1 RICIN domain-containing protein [Streptomyces bathyalis]
MKRSANRLLLVLGLLTALLGGLTAGSATAVNASRWAIINYQTGGHLTPYYYGKNDRDGIHIWTGYKKPTGDGNQWTFRSVNGGTQIRNEKTQKCLRPVRFGSQTRVEQWECGSTPEFQWRLTSAGGTYKITSVSTGNVLTPYSKSAHSVVLLEEDEGTQKQRWAINALN